MSYTDLRDFEAEYTWVSDSGATVQIEKLGGGAVGREYSGTWRYIVTGPDGAEWGRGQDLTTGMPRGHHFVAKMAAEYFEEG